MVKLDSEEVARFTLAMDKYTELREASMYEAKDKPHKWAEIEDSLVTIEMAVRVGQREVTQEDYFTLEALALEYTNDTNYLSLDADFQGEKLASLDTYWRFLLKDLGKLDPVRASHFGICVGLMRNLMEGKVTEIDLYQIEQFEAYLEDRRNRDKTE